MRAFLVLCLLLLWVSVTQAAKPLAYTRSDAVAFVLDDYCAYDCSGFLRTHSPRYRRTFVRALAGNLAALRRVFSDPSFHSGDNEAWEPIPGNLLFVVGDERFATFLEGLPADERRYALSKVPIAAPFHQSTLAGDTNYFARQFPRTHRLYLLSFPP